MFKKTRLCRGLMLAIGGSACIVFASSPALAQRVEITGSSIKRVEAEGALQVQTITRAEIDRLGVQTTEQLMQTISAMSSSGQTSTSTGVSLGTYGFSAVSLRGLGEERTLVLLNGRRLAAFADGSSAVNVNNIPLAALDRVEILKDGASAIYGSDAEAGVVNFILVKNFEGYLAGATYGTPTHRGGGQQYMANIVAGWGDMSKDNWNLTVSGQYQKNQNLMAGDRKFSKTQDNWPITLPTATGQGNIQGPWAVGVPVGNQSPDYAGGDGFAYGNPLAAANNCAQIKHLQNSPNFNFSGAAPDNPNCVYDASANLGLMAKTENASLTGNLAFRLSDKAELFADGLWSRTEVLTQIQPNVLRTSFMATSDLFAAKGIDPVLLLRPSNPNYGIAAAYLNSVGLGRFVGQDLGITARTQDFGPRLTKDTSTQSHFVVGVRGEVFDQFYNVAAATNQSKIDGQVSSGFFSMTGYAQATQVANSDWNPWSLNQSQAFNDLIATTSYAGPTLSSKSTLNSLDATLSGDVSRLPAGTVQYAAGYQYRNEKLKLSPSAALASGDIAGLGGATKALDADRNVNALFGELNIPVVQNLDLNLAARYDDYSDVGSTTNWKANLRWQPTRELLFRGSYGTGFRAPSLSNLFEPVTSQSSAPLTDVGNCAASDPTDCPVAQVTEFTGGNPELKPETSTQFSLGLVFQPLPSLAIGLDWFNIEVDNTISQPSTQEVVSLAAAGNPLYVNKVRRVNGNGLAGNGAIVDVLNPPDNNGTLTARGMDIDVRYREKIGPGLLGIALNGTYYFKYEQSSPGAGTSQKVATTSSDGGFTPVISSTIGLDGLGVILRYKQYLSATWSQDNWATTVGNSFATAYTASANWLDEPTRMPTQTIWDLQVAYNGFKNTVLTIGARNLFDKQPASFSNGWIDSQTQAGYDISQYDPRGRFVYLTGTYKF